MWENISLCMCGTHSVNLWNFFRQGVLSAQAIIALNTAHIKKNQNMLSASYAMATILPTIKGAPFTKKYKNEPFHRWETNLTVNPSPSNPTHTPDLAHHTLQRSHHNNNSTRQPPRLSNKYPPNNSKPTHNQVKYTNWKPWWKDSWSKWAQC